MRSNAQEDATEESAKNALSGTFQITATVCKTFVPTWKVKDVTEQVRTAFWELARKYSRNLRVEFKSKFCIRGQYMVPHLHLACLPLTSLIECKFEEICIAFSI